MTAVGTAGILRAIAQDPTDGINWLILADIISEERPGEMVACEYCGGWGRRRPPDMDDEEPDVPCRPCAGHGRHWRPNEDIARAREVPNLLAGEGRRVPFSCVQIYSWWDDAGGRKASADMYIIPPWLGPRLTGNRVMHSWVDYASADAAAADLHAALLAFAFAACGLTPCPACRGKGEQLYEVYATAPASGGTLRTMECHHCKGLGHLP